MHLRRDTASDSYNFSSSSFYPAAGLAVGISTGSAKNIYFTTETEVGGPRIARLLNVSC